MKRNTSCGHDKCPQPMRSDKAHTKTVFCEAFPFDPAFLANGTIPSAVDVAVPLTDVVLQADVEAKITLPTPAREIKWMKRNVSIKQCKAVPSTVFPTTVVKIFVTGIVHKNIQYVDSASGFVRDYSVDVPFSCNESVTLDNELFFPLFGEQFSNKNTILERKQLAKDELGSDRCETGALTWEINNEPIECKLMGSVVNDLDLYQDFDNWGRFNQITEKMEVLLLFKLYQKQQISTAAAVDGGGVAQAPEQPAVLERLRQILGRKNG